MAMDYAITACLVFLESLSHLSSIPPCGSIPGGGGVGGGGMHVPHLNFKSSIEEEAIRIWQ